MPRPDDDEAPRALIHVPKARSTALIPARSLDEAKLGEVILLDRRGNVLGPRQVALIKARSWGLVTLAGGGQCVFYGALLGPMWGVVSVIVFAALVGFQLRNWPALRVAYSLSANCQWEDAHAAFSALEGKGMPRPMRESASIALSALALSLGQPEKALERLELVIPRLRSSWRQGAMVNRWLATYLRAGALVRLGRLGEARQRRDEIRAWARGGRPRGEYYTLLQQSLDLAIAFEADAPDELPDDAVLHQWARAALLRSQFGEMLINLAWAFHRRGNDDMARHLFAEAPSRTPRYSLHVTSPRLHAWAEERRAAWLGNEGSEARPAPPLLGSGLTEA